MLCDAKARYLQLSSQLPPVHACAAEPATTGAGGRLRALSFIEAVL